MKYNSLSILLYFLFLEELHLVWTKGECVPKGHFQDVEGPKRVHKVKMQIINADKG